jgi:hypothetical protein
MKHLSIKRDGNMFMVHSDSFTNLQESTAGFGPTIIDALRDFATNKGQHRAGAVQLSALNPTDEDHEGEQFCYYCAEPLEDGLCSAHCHDSEGDEGRECECEDD